MMMRCEVREPKTFDVSDASTVVSHVTVEFKKRPFGVLAYATLTFEFRVQIVVTSFHGTCLERVSGRPGHLKCGGYEAMQNHY